MHLTLIRHGESTWNATGRWQGQYDVPLSERGRLQALALAARMVDAPFELRLASDLARALETAQALGSPLETERRLREIDVGAWEGLSHEEVATRFADELADLRAGRPVRIGGGESLPEFEARVDAVVAELAAANSEKRVLVVTHGGVVRALVTRVLGMRGRPSPLVGVGNTSLTRVSFEGAPKLTVYNDTAHLDVTDLVPSVTPEPTARVALVAADPNAPPDRSLADRILSRLGIARIGVAGAASGGPLSDDLVAEPLGTDATHAFELLRAEQEAGAFALLLTPNDVVTTLAELVGLTSTEGLGMPLHGAVAQLRVSRTRTLLHSYGVEL